jgi:hypothetical protein
MAGGYALSRMVSSTTNLALAPKQIRSGLEKNSPPSPASPDRITVHPATIEAPDARRRLYGRFQE